MSGLRLPKIVIKKFNNRGILVIVELKRKWNVHE